MSFVGAKYSHTCGPCKHTWQTQGAKNKQEPCPICKRANTVTRSRIISANSKRVEACA